MAVTPTQIPAIETAGGIVAGGLVIPRGGRCPFQAGDTHLCALHGTAAKPWGCIASPFTLNKRDTLIVRNRYRLLACFKAGRKLPAYHAFSASMSLLFGPLIARSISAHLDAGGGDLIAQMRPSMYAMLKHNAVVHMGAKKK